VATVGTVAVDGEAERMGREGSRGTRGKRTGQRAGVTVLRMVGLPGGDPPER